METAFDRIWTEQEEDLWEIYCRSIMDETPVSEIAWVYWSVNQVFPEA